MFKNMHYDMMEEMAELSKSVSRMDTYMKDSADCSECKKLWNELKKRHEEELKMVFGEFEKHVKQGGVSS